MATTVSPPGRNCRKRRATSWACSVAGSRASRTQRRTQRFIEDLQTVADRFRFKEFALDRLPGSRCKARVVLAITDDEVWVGEAEGLSSQAGELRTAADACVMALAKAIDGVATIELLGVKAVKAFDNNVVIVS